MKSVPVRTDTDMIGSASVTALMRYLLSDQEGLAKNPDYLGNHFVTGKWESYLKNPKESRDSLQRLLPGCIYYHLIRTKHFDQSLKKWIQNEKNSQIILLGAGFDSRALRFEREIKQNNIRVFEVDLYAMLSHKKEIISTKLKHSIEHVQYVSCNFTKDNVIEKLVSNGFDVERPTFVLWEGVTFFLTQKNVEDYLNLLRESIYGKLQIIFDYAFKDYIDGDLNFYGAKELYNILIELGEPHLFGVNYEDIEQFATANGYKLKSNYTSFMLEALYLKDKNGNSIGRPHAFHGIAEFIRE